MERTGEHRRARKEEQSLGQLEHRGRAQHAEERQSHSVSEHGRGDKA